MTLNWESRLLPETSFDGRARNNFGPLIGFEGIVWHTTEGGGFSRLAAENTITWQKDVPGSYNFVIFDGGLFLTIPYREASGGINPSSAAWAPERFPWLQQSLSPSAYANPTKYHLQVAFSGRRSAIDAGQMPANMLATALALRDWWEAEVAKREVLQSGHMHWQNNRTDPGRVFSSLTHATLPSTDTPRPEDPMTAWTDIDHVRYIPPTVATVKAGTILYRGPGREYDEQHTLPGDERFICQAQVNLPSGRGLWWLLTRPGQQGAFFAPGSAILGSETIAADCSAVTQERDDAIQALGVEMRRLASIRVISADSNKRIQEV